MPLILFPFSLDGTRYVCWCLERMLQLFSWLSYSISHLIYHFMCDRASNLSVTLHFETSIWWQLLSVLYLPFLYFKSSDVWKASVFCARLAVLCLPQLYFNPWLFGKLQTLWKIVHCIFVSLEKCLIYVSL